MPTPDEVAATMLGAPLWSVRVLGCSRPGGAVSSKVVTACERAGFRAACWWRQDGTLAVLRGRELEQARHEEAIEG